MAFGEPKGEVLVVAEPVLKYDGGIDMVIDLSGEVYRADWPACEIYPCCSDSFEQFLEMAEKYLSIYREGKAKELEMREREFCSSIQKIDPGALMTMKRFYLSSPERTAGKFAGISSKARRKTFSSFHRPGPGTIIFRTKRKLPSHPA